MEHLSLTTGNLINLVKFVICQFFSGSGLLVLPAAAPWCWSQDGGCRPFPSTLASPLDAGRSPQRWLVPLTLAGPLDAGWSPRRWPVPSMLAGSLNNGWSPRCWCHMLVLLRSPADASYCKSPLLLFILCYSFVVVYEYTFMYKMYKINKFARYK